MRLLLAEDEKDLSDALVTVLKHNNYSVDAVYNGQDALDYLTEGDNYDGAILDIMMPKLDGISVLKQVRAQGNHLPILMLTAKSEIDDRVNGLDSGADDYLTKPFSMKELACTHPGHDKTTGRNHRCHPFLWRCPAGPKHLPAVNRYRYTAACEQGIPDVRDADDQSRSSDLCRTVYGQNLGIRQ